MRDLRGVGMRVRMIGAVLALAVAQIVLTGPAVARSAAAPLSQPAPSVGSAHPEAVAATTGMLRVTTVPAVPSQILVDGVIANTWGLKWVHLEAGTHQVCFSSVPGYTTPACQTASIDRGQTTTITGAFVARGYLHVTTSPAVASQISVDGIPRNNWGVWTDLAVGAHRVCFGAVAGFTPPACQTVDVTAGGTTDVVGTFAPSNGAALPGVGFLRVVSSPALPTQITVDGAIADTWGLNWMEIAPGSHTVCFGRVEARTEPACQTAVVTAGATASVTGTFIRRGYLRVDTSPAVAGTISVNGIPADDWGVYTDVPSGSYRVCFGNVSGKLAPNCQTATVVDRDTTTVTGVYTQHWFCLDHDITTAADEYQVLNHNDDVWRGGDGAKSVVLPDGRVLWLFGDTLVGKVNPDGSLPPTGWTFVRGTGIVQQGACADPIVNPADPTYASALIPHATEDEFYWPDSAFVDASGTSLWVIAKDVKIDPSQPWGFSIPNQVAARFSLPDLQFQSLTPMPKSALANAEWALPYSEGGYVYLYSDNGFSHYVTRFPASDSNWATGASWQYWTGSAIASPWSTKETDGVSMSFDSAAIGLMYAVKTPTGYATVSQFYDKITSWKGPTPMGPWSLVGTQKDFTGTPDACVGNACRTYLGHAATDLPGVDPLIIWSRQADNPGSTVGGYLGVSAPLIPLG